MALAIAPELKKGLVHCEDVWYAFHPETNLWKKVKKPSYLIVSMIHKFLDKSIHQKNKESCKTEDPEIKKKISEDIEVLCKFYKGCDSPSYLSNMRDHLSIITLLTRLMPTWDTSRLRMGWWTSKRWSSGRVFYRMTT